MKYREEQELIKATIAKYPKQFGLRNHTGLYYISHMDSFYSQGTVQLYVFDSENDLALARCSSQELDNEIVLL